MGAVSLTWRSTQKLAEFDPLPGMLTDGSVPATPNTPCDVV